jgi:uncharacterized protein with HEPN domain
LQKPVVKNNEELESMASSIVLKDCFQFIESILGYKLSAADRQPFMYFHTYLTNLNRNLSRIGEMPLRRKAGIKNFQIEF